MTKDKVDALHKKAETAHRRYRDALWKYERETAYPRAAKLVGTVWTTQNSYSCPGPDDHWTLYFRIIGVTAAGIRYHQMEIDKDGKPLIELDRLAPFERFLDGRYLRASLRDWNAELRRVKKLIGKLE